jgi:hypothetical protein
MSRIVVYDVNNQSVGEFTAICNRGYTIHGEPSVMSGGGTQVSIDDAIAHKPWLQFGRLVEVQHDDLPTWVGMIDTPWKASLPAGVTLYPVEHLFTMRTPADSMIVKGSIADVVEEIIKLANSEDDLYLRLGNTDGVDPTEREETIEQEPLWDQLMAMLNKTATAMVFRPEHDDDNRLCIYLDLGPTGINTNLLLHDGENANMQIVSAIVDGKIQNSITGISSQSTTESRLQTEPLEDIESRDRYKLRSAVVQFANVTEKTTLEANTQAALAASSYPKLLLTVKAFNKNGEFQHLGLGNVILVHAANLRLPGGMVGWRGFMRIPGMVFSESDQSITLNLIGEIHD